MNKINVISVAYRNKNIIKTFDDLYENAYYKDNLIFNVVYLNSWKINFNVKNINSIRYMWDHPVGFIKHQNFLLNWCDENSYVLFVTPECSVIKNWDKELIEYFSYNEKCFITDNSKLNTFFMFTNKKNLLCTGYPHYLSLFGASEDLLIRAYCNDIKIDHSIENFISNNYTQEYDYLPFSKNSRYNEVENLYNNGYNSYVDLTKYGLKYLEYAKINPIKKIHHQLNDVDYRNEDFPELKPSRYTGGKSILTEAL